MAERHQAPLTHADLRRLLLALPGAFEDTPFGPDTYVYKVRGRVTSTPKMFALLWGDSARMNLKCEPALAEQLRAQHPQITPGYHMSKKHWNTVDAAELGPDGAPLDARMLADLIEDSYDLVVAGLPRADREALGWRRLAES